MASHTLALSHGRRLFELLDQQQEPFLLEVYLQENGCSCRSLKSDTLMKCWPLNSCKKLLDFNSHGFQRKRFRTILSCLLPKIVPWKLLRKVLNCYIRAPDFGTKKVFKRDDASFWKKAQEPKKLSPVSILELPSDEGCSLQNPSSTSSLHSESSEIPLHFACLSNSYRNRESSSNVLPQTKQLLMQCAKDIQGRVWEAHESLDQGQVFSMEKERSNASRIEQLIDEDLFNCRTEWNDFQAEKKEIGMEIGEFIFEDIKEESVIEMLRSNCILERD